MIYNQSVAQPPAWPPMATNNNTQPVELSLHDVLRQIPNDVLDARIWARLSSADIGAVKASCKPLLELVRGTKRHVVLATDGDGMRNFDYRTTEYNPWDMDLDALSGALAGMMHRYTAVTDVRGRFITVQQVVVAEVRR